MLYISRRIGESIIIDGKIEVVLHQISGKQVKIGVFAPRNTSVYRKELLDKILEENKMAYEAALEVFANGDESQENENNKFISDIKNKLSTLNSLLHKAIIEVKRGDLINVNSVFKIMTELEPIIPNVKDPLIIEIINDLVKKYDELLSEIYKKQKNLEEEILKIRNNMKLKKED